MILNIIRCLFIFGLCLGSILFQFPFEGRTSHAADDSPENRKAQAAAQDSSVDAQQQKVTEPALPWRERPYAVQVRLTFRESSTLTQTLRETWTSQLEELLTDRFGQMWELVVSSDSNSLTLAELRRMTSEEAKANWLSSHADKVFQLVLQEHGGKLQLAAREWDLCSQSLGSLAERSILDRRDVCGELASLVSQTFRPLVEIDVVEDGKIECLARAGEFPSRSPADLAFQKGDHIVPFLRYLDRNREVRAIQPIQWTYLQVIGIERARMQLELNSAFRAPLPRSRRRVEIRGLRARPQLQSTDVLIYPRGRRTTPLAGVRCLVGPDPIQKTEEDAPSPTEFMTNRRGIVTLPTHLDDPLQWLQIFSGEALLARVPVLPGVDPVLQLEVPDDRARLHVEGEVQLLEENLIDLVASREVLIARTQTAAKEKRWSDIDSFFKDLHSLTTQKEFLSQIDRLELQAVQQAKRKKNRVAESRIKRLCRSIRELAERHLDPSRIQDFEREIRSQRLKQ